MDTLPSATAILLLPSGHRAYDEDFLVDLPLPAAVDVTGQPAALFLLVHIQHAGQVDDLTRGLYVLGGEYQPHGAVRRLAPDEAHDQ